MKKFLFLVLLMTTSTLTMGQIGGYLFARTPHLVDLTLDHVDLSYAQAVSVGAGMTYKSYFAELGTFIAEGNTHGYYTFFGATLKTTEVSEVFRVNTGGYGEVTHLPTQSEISKATWTITGGVCLFPNLQMQNLNIGIPLCLGLAHQEGSFRINSRFILNLAFALN